MLHGDETNIHFLIQLLHRHRIVTALICIFYTYIGTNNYVCAESLVVFYTGPFAYFGQGPRQPNDYEQLLT